MAQTIFIFKIFLLFFMMYPQVCEQFQFNCLKPIRIEYKEAEERNSTYLSISFSCFVLTNVTTNATVRCEIKNAQNDSISLDSIPQKYPPMLNSGIPDANGTVKYLLNEIAVNNSTQTIVCFAFATYEKKIINVSKEFNLNNLPSLKQCLEDLKFDSYEDDHTRFQIRLTTTCDPFPSPQGYNKLSFSNYPACHFREYDLVDNVEEFRDRNGIYTLNSCKNDENPAVTISVQCDFSSAFGSISKRKYLFYKPEAPTYLKMEDNSQLVFRTVRLQWPEVKLKATSVNIMKITGYRVKITELNKEQPSDEKPRSLMDKYLDLFDSDYFVSNGVILYEASFQELRETTYHIKVAVKTNFGIGEYSQTILVRSQLLPPPTGLITEFGLKEDSISLRWDEPRYQIRDFGGYELKITDLTDEKTTRKVQTRTLTRPPSCSSNIAASSYCSIGGTVHYKINGLKENTDYRIQIRMLPSYGDLGNYSQPIIAFTSSHYEATIVAPNNNDNNNESKQRVNNQVVILLSTASLIIFIVCVKIFLKHLTYLPRIPFIQNNEEGNFQLYNLNRYYKLPTYDEAMNSVPADSPPAFEDIQRDTNDIGETVNSVPADSLVTVEETVQEFDNMTTMNPVPANSSPLPVNSSSDYETPQGEVNNSDEQNGEVGITINQGQIDDSKESNNISIV